MDKYDFIKNGNLLYWNDPDNGKPDGAYRVTSAPEEVNDDSIIMIATGDSEAEVLPSELSPISAGISHKKDFQCWKAEREAEGMEFFDRLSEVIDTDNHLAVGDMVVFTTNNRQTFIGLAKYIPITFTIFGVSLYSVFKNRGFQIKEFCLVEKL